MRVLIGVLFFFVLSLTASLILYFFLVRNRPKARRRGKPKAKSITSPKASLIKPQTQATPLETQTQTPYRYELPPEIPRDINTLKIIATEDPNIIIDIVRKWMRER
mgnify:FL=1